MTLICAKRATSEHILVPKKGAKQGALVVSTCGLLRIAAAIDPPVRERKRRGVIGRAAVADDAANVRKRLARRYNRAKPFRKSYVYAVWLYEADISAGRGAVIGA